MLVFFIPHILQGMESTCSSHPSSFSHFWHLLMQRSTMKASKSFRFSTMTRFNLVLDHFCSFQSILPTEKRVHMFQYLYGHPIQMTVYGHAISYGTIGKVLCYVIPNICVLFRHCGCWHSGCFCIQDSASRDWCCIKREFEIS